MSIPWRAGLDCEVGPALYVEIRIKSDKGEST